MDENLSRNNVVEMSAFQKCINIFISPKQTAESIERKSDLVLPLVLIVIMAIIVSLFSAYLQQTNLAIKQKMENGQIQMMKKMGLSDQQIEESLDKQQVVKNPILQYGGALIGAIFTTGIFMMLMTVIMWLLGNWILGRKPGFATVLAIFAYSSLIKYVGTILAIPLIINQGDLKAGFHLANIMDSNLAEGFMSTFMYSVSMFVNLFDIWTLCALSIGMAVIYKSSTTKAGVLTFAVWAFFVLLFSAGIAAISSLLGINLLMMS